MTKQRHLIDRMEFSGGYACLHRQEFLAILGAYRRRTLTKADLRVLAASLEAKVLHPKSKVDLQRITNARRASGPPLTAGAIRTAQQRLAPIQRGQQRGPKMIIGRKMVRAIAQGETSRSETITLLYYCYRRIKQCKRQRSLAPRERYARFRYGDLAALSGCARATLCRAVSRLRTRGFLDLIKVRKRSENTHGNLFVDGSTVSLTPQHRQGAEAPRKPTTPSRISDNTTQVFLTTLINKNPKRIIIKGKKDTPIKWPGRDEGALLLKPPKSSDPEMHRIFNRARGMLMNELDAVA